MDIIFYITSVIFVIIICFGLPLAIVQYRTANKKLKDMATKKSYTRYNY